MTIASPEPISAASTDTIVLSANGLRNSGSEAVLDVVLQHPPAACRLEITGRPVCAPGRELGIEAFVNGWWIGYWRLDGNDTVTLLADIEAEFLRPVPAGSFLKLAWRFTDAPPLPPLAEPGQFEFASIIIRTATPEADFDADAADQDIDQDIDQDLTDPGIRLMCLDETLPPEIDGTWYTFRLHRPAREVMLWSRSAIPSELGGTDDLRRLGIAVSCIEVDGRVVPLNHWSLRDGWQPIEAGWRWTNGAARLLLPDGAKTVRFQVATALARYQPDAAAVFSFDDIIGVCLLPGRVVIRLHNDLPADKITPLVRTGAGPAETLPTTQRWASADPLRPDTSLVMAVDLPALPSAPDPSVLSHRSLARRLPALPAEASRPDKP